jgi:hypothetical protein
VSVQEVEEAVMRASQASLALIEIGEAASAYKQYFRPGYDARAYAGGLDKGGTQDAPPLRTASAVLPPGAAFELGPTRPLAGLAQRYSSVTVSKSAGRTISRSSQSSE